MHKYQQLPGADEAEKEAVRRRPRECRYGREASKSATELSGEADNRRPERGLRRSRVNSRRDAKKHVTKAIICSSCIHSLSIVKQTMYQQIPSAGEAEKEAVQQIEKDPKDEEKAEKHADQRQS